MKSQTPSTKPGPRPEGGDSEGEITNKFQIPILQHTVDGDARWVLQPAYIM
jgi:hypothetical protein